MRLIVLALFTMLTPVVYSQDNLANAIAVQDNVEVRDVETRALYEISILVAEYRETKPKSRYDEVTKVDSKFDSNLNGATVLSRPQITTLVDVAASVRVGNASPIAYLEETAPGNFERKSHTPKQPPGIQMDILIQPPKVSITYESFTLDGTEAGTIQIAGVDVPIGKPIIVKHQRSWSLVFEEAGVYEVDLPTPNDTCARLRLQIHKVAMGDRSTSKPSPPKPLSIKSSSDK